MQSSKMYKPISELCWEGFDRFRNYCNSLHPELSGNQSMELVMNAFKGSYDEWSSLVKGVSNGTHKELHH